MGNERPGSHSMKDFAVLALTLVIGAVFIGGLIVLTDAYGDQFGRFMTSAPLVVNVIVLVVLWLIGVAAGLVALSSAFHVFYGRWWG